MIVAVHSHGRSRRRRPGLCSWVGGQPWSAALSRRSISSKPSAQSACSLLARRVCALRGRNGLPHGRRLSAGGRLVGRGRGCAAATSELPRGSPPAVLAGQRARHTPEENLACHHLDVCRAAPSTSRSRRYCGVCAVQSVSHSPAVSASSRRPAHAVRSPALPCLALPRSLARSQLLAPCQRRLQRTDRSLPVPTSLQTEALDTPTPARTALRGVRCGCSPVSVSPLSCGLPALPSSTARFSAASLTRRRCSPHPANIAVVVLGNVLRPLVVLWVSTSPPAHSLCCLPRPPAQGCLL